VRIGTRHLNWVLRRDRKRGDVYISMLAIDVVFIKSLLGISIGTTGRHDAGLGRSLHFASLRSG
jgi:hypothetical protein